MEVVDLSRDFKHVDALLAQLPAFSLDLLQASQHELTYLRSVDEQGGGGGRLFYSEPFLRQAVRRYERHWVPFLTAQSKTPEDDLALVPPPDVHWVWHVHMLSPVAYALDCKQMAGRTLGHRARPQAQLAELRAKTEKAWNAHFEGKVPYNVDAVMEEEAATKAAMGAAATKEEAKEGAEGEDFPSKIKYNIVAAALRQGSFYYQVSLDHYRDNYFMADALKRYAMYLYLKKQHPDKFLVPCYDMDLVWHTHQVHPVEYQRDTAAILGFVLKHDDSVNDRSEGSKLNTSDDITRSLWRETFGLPFARPGSMFRGNPPQGKLLMLTEKYQRGLLAPKQMDVELNSVRMPAMPPNVKLEGDAKAIFSVQLETGTNGGLMKQKKCVELYSSECSLNVDSSGKDGGVISLESPEGGKGLVHFAVSHANCPRLNLRLVKPSKGAGNKLASWLGGIAGVNGRNRRRASIALSETPIDLFALTSFANCNSGSTKDGATAVNGQQQQQQQQGSSSSSSSSDLTDLSISHRLTVNADVANSSKEACQEYILSELRLSLTNERLGTPTESKFRIQPGSFYDCIIPEDVETLWGPIPLQRLPRGVSNKCRAVTHG